MDIRGTTTVTLQQAQEWARANGAHQRFIDVAPLYWEIAPRYEIPPDVAYAQAAKETNYGHYTGVVPADYHNWAGIKTAAGGGNDDPAAHARFANDRLGVLAHIQHLARYAGAQGLPAGDPLVDPRWLRVTKFTSTVEGLGGPDSWAPASDYGADVAAITQRIRAWAAQHPDRGAPMVTVALAAGHRNASGGDAEEQRQTGILTPLIAAALRRRGITVRVLTPDDGRGMFPGGLDALAGQVTTSDDLFMEVHTEGTSGYDVSRGVFVVYPDWPSAGDLDTDVRDRLGPDIARRVSQATGMPLRGAGVMSETQTGVGDDGYRLGVFRVTAPLRSRLTRMIVEYGAHTSPADMAVWARPGAPQAMADATADAIAAFYGIPVPKPEEPQEPAHGARYFPETGQSLGGGFLSFWEARGGLELFGYPLTGEIQEGGITVQYTERARLEYRPDNPDPYTVQLGRIGAELLAARAEIERLRANPHAPE